MLPVTSGKCGLRQSEAVFLHNKNLTKLFEDCPKSKIDFVAASRCPSERTDSYMPCFVVGVSFATVLSELLKVPLYTCSHQKAHIAAALYSGDCIKLLNNPFFAYHVSGGTTDILLCKPEENALNVLKIGGTADISCGQLIDRAGVALGFPFPCGKYIEKYSNGNLVNNVKIAKNKFFYNFSGFENKVDEKICSGCDKNALSDYILSIVYSFISQSVTDIRYIYKNLPVIFSGGVMSNKYISEFVTTNIEDVYFSDPKYSVDNALGVAYMCAYEGGLLDD